MNCSNSLKIIVLAACVGTVTLARPPAPKPAAKPQDMPATLPAAVHPHPGIGSVTKRLVIWFARDPQRLDGRAKDNVMRLALTSGDITSTREFLDSVGAGEYKMRYVGFLATCLPGGVKGAESRALIARHKVDVDMFGTIEGFALGYMPTAMNWPKLLQRFESSIPPLSRGRFLSR